MKKNNEERKYFIYYTEEDLGNLQNRKKEDLIRELKDVYLNVLNFWMEQTEGLLNDMNKMIEIKKEYELALFITIRNNVIMPQGIELGKTEKEINKMAFETMKELFKLIDFKSVAKKMKEAEEDE